MTATISKGPSGDVVHAGAPADKVYARRRIANWRPEALSLRQLSMPNNGNGLEKPLNSRRGEQFEPGHQVRIVEEVSRRALGCTGPPEGRRGRGTARSP